MKDIRITGMRIRTEIIWFLACIGAGVLLNLIGIIKYNTSWTELFSQLHVVVLVALVLYFISGIVRILIYLMSYLFRSKQ